MSSSAAVSFKHVEALIFDVFGSFHLLTIDVLGTVVDWRKSVVDYLRTLPQPSTPLDHESFAQEWRHGYYLATRQFAESPDPSKFQTIDEIHFSILRDLVTKHKLESVWNENLLQEINLVWHRLYGWPDATQGLNLLKKRFIIGTLSNGNARLLIDMAKYADLPWDVIFSGDLLKAYKPNERMYLGACEYLQLPPEKVGMVAAHLGDLKAAKSFGLKTLYVKREKEDRDATSADTDYVDVLASDFVDAAVKLGIGH